MKQTQDQLDNIETELIISELANIIANKVDGDVVEFGCYRGLTTVQLARVIEHTSKQLFVYDSFEGLPEKSSRDISPLGVHFRPGELRASKQQLMNVVKGARVPIPRIKKAWFKDLQDNDLPGKIAFAFIDCDFYDSVRESLKLIENKMVPGSRIIVDDYSNPALPGSSRAVDDWLAKKHYKFSVMHSLAIIRI